MIVLGTVMRLTRAPATEAIMGVVSQAKAGVDSAMNDATRLLGGTLGVAVIGSVFASIYASRLGDLLPAALPGGAAGVAKESAGAALSIAGEATRAGHPALGTAVSEAANSAFFSGFHAAGVAATGAVVAFALLPAQPTAADEDGALVVAAGN
ncbi:MAG TPA: hypothetical protein VGC32_09785 [Solirubrobacterales bacterium]